MKLGLRIGSYSMDRSKPRPRPAAPWYMWSALALGVAAFGGLLAFYALTRLGGARGVEAAFHVDLPPSAEVLGTEGDGSVRLLRWIDLDRQMTANLVVTNAEADALIADLELDVTESVDPLLRTELAAAGRDISSGELWVSRTAGGPYIAAHVLPGSRMLVDVWLFGFWG